MRRRGVVGFIAICFLIGCGSGGAKDDGGAAVHITGTAGAAGSGGGGAGGGVGPGSCAISTRPVDPIHTSGPTCNTLAFGAGWISADPLDPGDAGTLEQPAGGTIIDGDYDLVSFRSSIFGERRTRRSIRIFDGATYVEWLMDNDNVMPDAGVMSYVFDTSTLVSGTDLAMVMVTCGDNEFSSRFGYSAAGTDFLLYQYANSIGDLQNVFTYRRTCTR